jgi:hypothetical protein
MQPPMNTGYFSFLTHVAGGWICEVLQFPIFLEKGNEDKSLCSFALFFTSYNILQD